MVSHPPLTGIRVLEFAGLAPGPFAGLLLADYGATVLRIDRAHPQAHSATPPPPTADFLTRRKSSIAVDVKSRGGLALLKSLIPHVDVVIDPFRPGVLEKLGLSPTSVLQALNPRVVVARMTGFRRDGKYKDMAGHDINYIAVSGVLALLGRAGDKPFAPGNILGDFAGGGAVCFMGVLLALLARQRSGRGQVVEANMVDGSAVLASMPRFGLGTPLWDGPRGTNMLDSGAHFYDTYETADGGYMAVGAIEPQFYARLVKGLGLNPRSLPAQQDKKAWPKMKQLFTETFKTKTRAEWEKIFDGTDACCTPVLTNGDLKERGFKNRPIVTLKDSPALATANFGADVVEDEKVEEAVRGQGPGSEGEGYEPSPLSPGVGGEDTLSQWVGWKRGKQFNVESGGLVLSSSSKL